MFTARVISFLILFAIAQSLEVQVQNGKLSQQMNLKLNSSIRYIINFPRQRSGNPYRIETWSANASPVDPILVEVELQRDSMVWSVPLTLRNSKLLPISYQNTSRILCDRNLLRKIQNFTVTLSTYSLVDIDVSLEITEDDIFYVKNDENYTISVSPSQPQYFFYNFTFEENGTIILEIDSNDDRCLTASIQKNHCPVFDLDKDISYAGGIHQTIQRSGWMTINRRTFPDGFFLVFAAKVDDYLCNTRGGPFSDQISKIDPKADTTVNFFISKGRSDVDYKYAALVIFVIILGFSIFVVGIAVASIFFSLKNNSKNNNYDPLIETVADDPAVDDSSGQEDEGKSGNLAVLNAQSRVEEKVARDLDAITIEKDNSGGISTAYADLTKNGEASFKSHPHFKCNNYYHRSIEAISDDTAVDNSSENRKEFASSIDQGEEDETGVENNEKEKVAKDLDAITIVKDNSEGRNTEELVLTLADLAKNCETNLKSHRYFKYTLNMAIFYIIPVVQLMVTYQKVVNSTGNSDLCYYNFRCANPGFWFLGFLSDFNHFYSNIGYILMGFLFLGVVCLRKWFLPKRQTGVPANYDIFYAMGTALIAEGVLSACYHICPTQSHFQFDTSFMYVMAVLCILKLYQNRHPDITPATSSTFIILASIIFLAMMGLIANSHAMEILWGSSTVLLYFIFCTYLSRKIYYFGDVSNALKAKRPPKSARFKVVLSVYIFNLLMLITVAVLYFEHILLNLGTLLLTILMTNAILYAVIYSIMKIKYYGERIVSQAIIYAVLSALCWVPAAYFFFQNEINPDVSPAQSRSWNQECVFLDFYDKHDLWHLFSSWALFCTFMYLLCLDDDIIHKKRDEIIAF